MDDPALSQLEAPTDPRGTWDLPPFGDLRRIEHLDQRVTRVLAPNPGPMTLDGTNTYVVGDPGAGDAVIVDPGPADDDHLDRVRGELARRDAACVVIAVTHRHVDHAAAARGWAERFDCDVAAATRAVAGEGGRVLADGDELHVAGVGITAVATPGHSDDHLAFRLDHGPLLTGDHILGRGTSVIAHPDGDLVAYLDSLRRVLDLGPDALLPGHGPTLTRDPSAVTRYYLDHRRFRERQILTLLEEGPHHATTLVRRIYTDVDPAVLPAAAASTRAALEKLATEDLVEVDAGGTATLRR